MPVFHLDNGNGKAICDRDIDYTTMNSSVDAATRGALNRVVENHVTDNIEDVTCAACMRVHLSNALLDQEVALRYEIDDLKEQVQLLVRFVADLSMNAVPSVLCGSVVAPDPLKDGSYPYEGAVFDVNSGNCQRLNPNLKYQVVCIRNDDDDSVAYSVEDAAAVVPPEPEEPAEPTLWDHLG
jgi:phosphoglucomutase